MSDCRADEVHLADVALVLLLRGDLPRVGRPRHDRAVAGAPAGVVGGVAEVLHAVGGERLLLPALHVADPEVPVADEDAARAVWRNRDRLQVGRRGAAAASPSSTPGAATPAPSRRDVLGGAVHLRRGTVGKGGPRLLRRIDDDDLVAGEGL